MRDSVNTITYTDVGAVDVGRSVPDAYLVLAMSCHSPGGPIARISIGDVREVLVGRGPVQSVKYEIDGAGRRLCLTLADPWMSGAHARLLRTMDGWTVEDCHSKNGTRLNGAAVRRMLLGDGDVIEVGGTFLVFDGSAPRLVNEPTYLEIAEFDDLPPALVTLNADLARKFRGLRRIAPTSVPVIITGDTGTGKELTARALHDLSDRDGPLVAVNCGAIPEQLVESVLFGHKRGAFTGATEDRPGLIRSAAGGTLFLDEVAELPEQSQVALLRFLQEGEVRPVGDETDHDVDTRIVAATHQDLRDRVSRGLFRRDLYARLAGYRLHLPPLRERKQDLGYLVSTLLRQITAETEPTVRFRASAIRAMFEYAFPLNIRELHHMLRSALVIAEGAPIHRSHLPDTLANTRNTPAPRPMSDEDRALRAEVVELLRQTGGNVSAVARAMGKAPVQIRRWCRRLDIDVQQFRA